VVASVVPLKRLWRRARDDRELQLTSREALRSGIKIGSRAFSVGVVGSDKTTQERA
jgi:hypothetical protein